MSDFLIDSWTARALIRTLRLPLPVPERLERASGPWEARPLEGRVVVAGTCAGATLSARVAHTIAAAGARAIVDAGEEWLRAFAETGEAFGRPPVTAADLDAERAHGLVLDASGIRGTDDLRVLYDFFHRWIHRLDRGGRVIVLGRPPEDAPDAQSAAVRRALEGFVRSLAKEIGRRGATAQTLLIDEGAESRLEGVLRFLLSKRSAFVSAQALRVTARARAAVEVAWVRPLDGRVALVTGAARGIGAAIAERLADEGAHVVCLDRPQDATPLAQVARQIRGEVFLADVTEPAAPARIAEYLRERHDGVDVVVHNAGVTRDRTLARMDEARWQETVAVNLAAPLRITAALLEGALRDDGRIICLSSIAGISGNVGQTNYAASKAGLIGFVRHQAGLLAERGITVNAVAPGFIETRMTDEVPFFVREVGRRLSALGQGGLPQDVAEVITFLATPAASGLTGEVIRICGGAYLGA